MIPMANIVFFFLDNVLVAVVVQLASARTVLVRQSLIVLRSFLKSKAKNCVVKLISIY